MSTIPGLAFDGYLVYTNFSFEGRTDEALGYIRYNSVQKIFKQMEKKGFTPERIFQETSCSFYNSLLDIDLKNPYESPNKHSSWFGFHSPFRKYGFYRNTVSKTRACCRNIRLIGQC